MPDEALFRCSISEKSPSLLSLEKVLDTFYELKKFPDIPVCTPEEHRVSQQNSRTDPFFPPHLEMRVLSLLRLQRNPDLPVAPQEEASLTLKCQRNSRGRSTIRKDPMSTSTQDKAFFPCNDSYATPSINSQHQGRTESTVASLEIRPDPDLSSTGGLTPLLHLEREAQFKASI